MKTKILIAVLLGLFLFIPGNINAQLADSPWPTFHGSVGHGGQSAVDTSSVDGTLKWVFEAGDAIESSPVIGADGTIYFGSHNGNLYALNPAGTKKWEFFAGKPIYDARWKVSKAIMATPAIASDGTIYIYSSASNLIAVTPDGKEKWRFYVKWGNDFWSSPTVGPDGTIYIGSARDEQSQAMKGGLYAINPDGTEKWKYDMGCCGVTSTAAVASDGTIYFGGNDMNPSGKYGNVGKVYALAPDGTKKWEFTIEQWMESSPSIGPAGTIYTGTGREAKILAFTSNGTKKWEFQAKTGVSAVPAIGKDDTIYVGAWDTYMYALDKKSGKQKWEFKTPEAFEGITSSAAIGADGTIYFGSNSGNFYALHPDGTQKWIFTQSRGSGIVTSPAIGADGTIYFGSENGKFFAVSGPEKEEDSGKSVTESATESETKKTEKKAVQAIYYLAGAAAIIVVLTVGVGIVIFLKKRRNKLRRLK